MTNYAKIAGKNRRGRSQTMTPQTQPIPGREADMVQNNAGGYSFRLDTFSRLKRFLILGVEGNTFYQSQQELVRENVKVLDQALSEDPFRVVEEIREVLASGRAYRPHASLFCLAAAASYGIRDKNISPDSHKVRSRALEILPEVIHIPTNLFIFTNYVLTMRGWGRSLRNAVANWYLQKDVGRLAMHSWKYKSREGWTNGDLLRVSHPKADEIDRAVIFNYMVRGETSLNTPEGSFTNDQIAAAEELLHITGSTKAEVGRAVNLIQDHRLTREAVPGHLLNEKVVWEALIRDMPVTAMVRNLGKMTNIGLISTFSGAENLVLDRLQNEDLIRRSKAHPMQFLIALKQYEKGHGDKGSLTWTPSTKAQDGLNAAFELAFGNVPVTGKRILLAGDDSGSMQGRYSGSTGAGLSPAEGAAAMMYITHQVEPNVELITYSTSYHRLNVTKRISLSGLLQKFGNGGGTDTSLPLKFVEDNKLDVDAIVSYTDSETWAGGYGYGYSYRNSGGHVSEHFHRVQSRLGHAVRYMNVAMTASRASDVDPDEPNMMELVGLDSNTPTVIGDFTAGNF